MNFYICYNAIRQNKKAVISLYGQRTNPQTVMPYSLGILLFFYSGKAPTRLVVVLMIVITV